MPCGLPLAVHRHASIAGVMLTRRGAFLWLLGCSAIFNCGRAAYPRDSLCVSCISAVHSNRRNSLYAPGDLWGEGGEFHLLEIEHLVSCVTAP